MEFQVLQRQLAAHVRDPDHAAGPAGVEDRRLKIYRELFYNNIQEFIANGFPVLRSITPDDAWHRRVRDFFARHRCRDPQFFRIAEEFLEFLDTERGEHPDDPPFIRELCHYEWIELELSVSEEETPAHLFDPDGDLLEGRPLVSPLAYALTYEWPVHRISKDFQPAEPGPQPTYLVVNRDRHDQVRFLEMNPVTARLMQLLETDHGSTGRELLMQIAVELQHPRPHEVRASGAAILKDLRARDVLLGTRR